MSALDAVFRQLAQHAPPPGMIDPLARVAPEVALPDDVVVKAGAYLPAGTVLEGGCRIGPNAVVVDGAPVTVKRGAQVGANATLMPGITLGANCVVQPGAVVTRSVPPAAIVEGSPAAIVGYVGAAPSVGAGARRASDPLPGGEAPGVRATGVKGVTVHHLPLVHDLRGDLSVGEFERSVPFAPQRYFIVFGVPNREIRGEHAHRACHQFLVCARGDCSVIADDGTHKAEVRLDAPNKGLYLPPMTWGIQYKHSPDAVLLVFASHWYDAGDYIREYEQFLREVQQ